MAQVRIEQRNGRLATDVRVGQVETREGPLAKATMVVISNGYRNGESEATSIRWTAWGKQAENAGKYLTRGSRVNVVGSVKNNNYEKDGVTVYGFNFTADEIDYLDSRGERETRSEPVTAAEPAPAKPELKAKGRGKTAKAPVMATSGADGDDDVPF